MPNKQQYQIVRGGVSRRIYGAKDRITREAHALAVQHTDGETAKGNPLALWATDLRRGRLNIYGSLLRFLDHLHRRAVAMETALVIPEWIASYIVELWTGEPAVTVRVVLVREDGRPLKQAA